MKSFIFRVPVLESWVRYILRILTPTFTVADLGSNLLDGSRVPDLGSQFTGPGSHLLNESRVSGNTFRVLGLWHWVPPRGWVLGPRSCVPPKVPGLGSFFLVLSINITGISTCSELKWPCYFYTEWRHQSIHFISYTAPLSTAI